MLYALGFIGLFTIGGLTGLFLATLAVDMHVHGTYFVIAHFHYIMVGGMVMAYLGGIHFWWPKISGRMYQREARAVLGGGDLRRLQPDVLAAVHPRRYLGMPRRYPSTRRSGRSSTCSRRPERRCWRSVTCCRCATWAGRSFSAKPAPQNPWNASGLEWNEASSPPIRTNFEKIPRVTKPAYDYPSSLKETAQAHA